MIEFDLPLPPSANNMFVNVAGRGRRLSKTYKDWRAEAGWLMKLQPRPKIAGAWSIAIEVPAKMRGDIDNRLKAVPDLLVKMSVVDDDRKVESVSIKRSASVERGRCRVRAWAVSEEKSHEV